MRKVLIATGAAIVLAAAVFAIVHYSAPREQMAVKPDQGGWVPVAVRETPRLHKVGAFGAWSLFCRDLEPAANEGKAAPNKLPGTSRAPQTRGRCVVWLVMRNQRAKRELLNLRLLNSFSGDGQMMQVIYQRGPAHRPDLMAERMPIPSVEVKADGRIITLLQRCLGVCVAMSNLTSYDLDAVQSARSLVIQLSVAKPAKANIVTVPTEGLKAALAAFRRQTP
jgi:invasion protein IalB